METVPQANAPVQKLVRKKTTREDFDKLEVGDKLIGSSHLEVDVLAVLSKIVAISKDFEGKFFGSWHTKDRLFYNGVQIFKKAELSK